MDPSPWTPLEEISRLVGHHGSAVTELVYRHELRPLIESGATVMDTLFQTRSHTVSHTGPAESGDPGRLEGYRALS